MKNDARHRHILLVTIGYGLFASLWILLSDALLSHLLEPAAIQRLSTEKGLLFVLVTTLLLFLALLPQFTSARWDWPITAQLGLLGFVFMVTCAVFYLCLGSFARRVLQARPLAAGLITRISGAAMVVIGALLLIDRFIA